MRQGQGHYSEQVRNESYRETLDDQETLNDLCRKILWQLISGPKTLQELAVILGKKESSICGRLNELKEDEWVIATKEAKWNEETKRNNTLWDISPEKFKTRQLEIF